MNLLTEIFLSWRYFKPKRNAVSVITVISILGVSLGVCVLMVVLSVMTGFTDEIKEKLLDVKPHIQVQNYNGDYLPNPNEITKKIESMGTRAVSLSEGQILVQRNEEISPQFLIGIDKSIKSENNFLPNTIQYGEFDISKGHILISYVLANKLNIQPGEKLFLHSPSKLKEMVKISKKGNISKKETGKVYMPSEFVVSGIFNTGMYEFDKNTMITNRYDANDLFGYPWSAATKVSVKTNHPFDIENLKNKISKSFPHYQVLSWKDTNRKFLNVLSVEKNMMFFVLIFIILVAASSITNTLITVVVQKTREIGLLRAIGATSGNVMRIFILQGFFVGTIGTIIGLSLGYIVIYWRMGILNILSNIFNIQIFPKEFYFLNKLPATVALGDILFISICTIALCTLGAVVPAYRAAKLDPAKALRYE